MVSQVQLLTAGLAAMQPLLQLAAKSHSQRMLQPAIWHARPMTCCCDLRLLLEGAAGQPPSRDFVNMVTP